MKYLICPVLFIIFLSGCFSNGEKKSNENSLSSNNSDSIFIKEKSGYAEYYDPGYENEIYHKQWLTSIKGDWLNYSTSTIYNDFELELKFFEKNSKECLLTKNITLYGKYFKPFHVSNGWDFRIPNCDDLDKSIHYRVEWRLIKAIPYIK